MFSSAIFRGQMNGAPSVLETSRRVVEFQIIVRENRHQLVFVCLCDLAVYRMGSAPQQLVQRPPNQRPNPWQHDISSFGRSLKRTSERPAANQRPWTCGRSCGCSSVWRSCYRFWFVDYRLGPEITNRNICFDRRLLFVPCAYVLIYRNRFIGKRSAGVRKSLPSSCTSNWVRAFPRSAAKPSQTTQFTRNISCTGNQPYHVYTIQSGNGDQQQIFTTANNAHIIRSEYIDCRSDISYRHFILWRYSVFVGRYPCTHTSVHWRLRNNLDSSITWCSGYFEFDTYFMIIKQYNQVYYTSWQKLMNSNIDKNIIIW